ncbi:MAG TPA: phosphatidylglycerol lysyltransferase domain-containing protein [Candidatus Saccharicenans sp.]|nr:phosphatidylglycerol lysyltransferase domain-containing protein [Candidatus Saccharicenans sp.]HQO76432.1 phosphatidylglycerol lysyltransferase domain-containing protein [Candidatus Saccharicenans sp.]HUM79770.1 phosphatidylglycerol lysyltransferase domain-containing protein [Candidatus Saccharicenans sp.]
MIPDFPELKPIELKDKEEVQNYLEHFPPDICELTFANIYIWREWEKPRLTKINGNLCVLCSPPDEPAYFLEPVGENKLDATVNLGLTLVSRWSRLSEKFLGKLAGQYIINEDRDNFDYVYLTQELGELSGKKYDGKRNWVRRFEKQFKYELSAINQNDLPGCLELVREWGRESADRERQEGKDNHMGATVRAMEEALLNFGLFGFSTLAVHIDDRVEGFCLGEKLNPETAVVHIEVASREFPGLYQFLNRECARRAWQQFRYINREQDAGLPGLRRAKLSYHPHHLVRKYNLYQP